MTGNIILIIVTLGVIPLTRGAMEGHQIFRTCGKDCNETLVDAFNQFGIDLHMDMIKENANGNMLFSPYSIATCFMMVLLGSAGDTADSISEIFHVDGIVGTVHDMRKCLDNSINGKTSVMLNTANRIFPDETLHLHTSFESDILSYFGEAAEIKKLDFKATEQSRKYINDWIANVTNDKLQNVIQPDNIDAMTVIVLVNAIYFKGAWKYKFDKALTEKADFHVSKDKVVQVELMKRPDTFFKYTSSPKSILDAQLVELPYVGDCVSMVIILPNEGSTIEALEKKLNAKLLRDELSYLVPDRNTTVYLPKFKLKTRYILNNNLKAMGMDHVFAGADLSKMADDERLSINEVIHQAFIEVNEDGTEAAAVTVIAGGRAGPPPPNIVRCDHPFIFLIRDLKTDAILFWGKYVMPEPLDEDNNSTVVEEMTDSLTSTTEKPSMRNKTENGNKDCETHPNMKKCKKTTTVPMTSTENSKTSDKNKTGTKCTKKCEDEKARCKEECQGDNKCERKCNNKDCQKRCCRRECAKELECQEECDEAKKDCKTRCSKKKSNLVDEELKKCMKRCCVKACNGQKKKE